jgi:hypothetical protein
MQSFSLKINNEWFSVSNCEENFQIVKLNLFRIVIDIYIHLLTRLEATSLRFNMENLLLENMAFKSLFLCRFTRISPWFHFNFVVIRHFERPFCWDTTNVFQ